MNNYLSGDYEFHAKKGWECPKCGAVMAPSTPMCWYCKPIKETPSFMDAKPFNVTGTY